MEIQQFAHYFLNMRVFLDTLPSLAKGLWVTIQIGVLSVLIGLTLGLALAIVRVAVKRPNTPRLTRSLNSLIAFYVDTWRCIPTLVTLVVVYYALPYLGLYIPRFWSAILAFVLILSSYSEEIFRATIEAIDRGQIEAAHSLGLTYLQMMQYVVIPQAFRTALPPLTNRTIAIIKDVSLASVIGVTDLLKKALAAQAFLANPTPLMSAAFFFTLLFLPLVIVSRYLERRSSQ